MLVALFDFCRGRHDHVAQALIGEDLAIRRAIEVDDARSCDAALLMAGAVDGALLRFIGDLRAGHRAMAQLVVTEQDDVDARVAAYDAGADDCFSKPFHLRELLAKLRAIRRRGVQGSAIRLFPGSNVFVDQLALKLRAADRAESLTKREADLLVVLARASGGPVRREEILREAWDAAPGLSCNLVDVYVGYARRKLRRLGADVLVKSVRGEGFRLAPKLEEPRHPSAGASVYAKFAQSH